MTGARLFMASAALLAASTVAYARIDADVGRVPASRPYLQCVPYARQVSGIQIYGDAYTWWNQARGRYARGTEPRPGAVMTFRPHGSSRLGHVAAVSRVVDDRTVLIKHANWSEPGKIENNVRAVDVSDDGDWSEVRVWYGPSRALGASRWPLQGFIYNEAPGKEAKPAEARPSKRRDREIDLPAGRSDPIGDIIAASRR